MWAYSAAAFMLSCRSCCPKQTGREKPSSSRIRNWLCCSLSFLKRQQSIGEKQMHVDPRKRQREPSQNDSDKRRWDCFHSIDDYRPLWWWLGMKTDGNGRKNLISTSVFIFFGGNGIGFGKYEYGNGIGLRGSTKTNQYGRWAGKNNAIKYSRVYINKVTK